MQKRFVAADQRAGCGDRDDVEPVNSAVLVDVAEVAVLVMPASRSVALKEGLKR